MVSVNLVCIGGNITKDLEVKTLEGGSQVCNFSVAVNRKWKKDGEVKEDVCFVDVTAWGKTAELVGKYLSKGSPVLIEGELRQDKWESEGKKMSRLKVVANRVHFLGKKMEGEQTATDTPPTPPPDDPPF